MSGSSVWTLVTGLHEHDTQQQTRDTCRHRSRAHAASTSSSPSHGGSDQIQTWLNILPLAGKLLLTNHSAVLSIYAEYCPIRAQYYESKRRFDQSELLAGGYVCADQKIFEMFQQDFNQQQPSSQTSNIVEGENVKLNWVILLSRVWCRWNSATLRTWIWPRRGDTWLSSSSYMETVRRYLLIISHLSHHDLMINDNN